ncbi:hypothetical protein [Nonomuraea sp. NPDC048826]|uniref:hypothetical protein n=1 Tax=Nonomuraea sp. NPDC048826 TaxID=3364347 RepID=UPI00370FB6C6
MPRLWPLECLCCWHVWEEAYTVRLARHGEIWLMGGVVVQPPWSGATCPSCGGIVVTSFPDGYLARHPELISAAEPEPVPVVVAAIDVVPPPVAARPPRHHRLLIMLGVPLVLAAAYEVYRAMATTAPH